MSRTLRQVPAVGVCAGANASGARVAGPGSAGNGRHGRTAHRVSCRPAPAGRRPPAGRRYAAGYGRTQSGAGLARRGTGAESALPEETRRQVTAERVRSFIRQKLHDPELAPTVVAAAHHISLSYLHRIFQQESPGETVGAWIRGRRLEGARRDRANPALRGLRPMPSPPAGLPPPPPTSPAPSAPRTGSRPRSTGFRRRLATVPSCRHTGCRCPRRR